jgi:hypothetical protein
LAITVGALLENKLANIAISEKSMSYIDSFCVSIEEFNDVLTFLEVITLHCGICQCWALVD